MYDRGGPRESLPGYVPPPGDAEKGFGPKPGKLCRGQGVGGVVLDG